MEQVHQPIAYVRDPLQAGGVVDRAGRPATRRALLTACLRPSHEEQLLHVSQTVQPLHGFDTQPFQLVTISYVAHMIPATRVPKRLPADPSDTRQSVLSWPAASCVTLRRLHGSAATDSTASSCAYVWESKPIRAVEPVVCHGSPSHSASDCRSHCEGLRRVPISAATHAEGSIEALAVEVSPVPCKLRPSPSQGHQHDSNGVDRYAYHPALTWPAAFCPVVSSCGPLNSGTSLCHWRQR